MKHLKRSSSSKGLSLPVILLRCKSKQFEDNDLVRQMLRAVDRPFPSCFEPHYESEAECKVFHLKVRFHSYANKTKYHEKLCT